MTNLLIDIGNTTCKVAFESEGQLGDIYRSPGLDVTKFILSVIGEKRPDVVVLSNVREDNVELEKELRKRCGKLVVVNPFMKMPVDISYDFDATEMGSDRLAGAIGALMLFPGKDIIKFDFGTALTIDYITKEGLYLGGNISLGMRSRFRALYEFTKRLPFITPDPEFPPVGVTTTGAMTAVVVFGLIFEVEGYINDKPNSTVIFTGGDAIYFANRLKKTIFVVPNLVLLGLAQIADYYAKEI